nr:TOPRIM nucleotidyl transferase/hydrolase domain-containing protein [Secundilactobacillus oryzae]
MDATRLRVQDIVDVFSKDGGKIALRDMGSATESFVKTELAINQSDARLILLEEPENHLSFTQSRLLVDQIKKFVQNSGQLIVTTHESLLVTRLNLRNLIWLSGKNLQLPFSELDAEVAEFFERMDNLNILQVILSNKLILVEGPTEYIAIESMIKAVTKSDSNSLGIHIMSMHGDLMKRFRPLVKILGTKTLIITDNDGAEEKMKDRESDEKIYVATPSDTNLFTFEVALYEENKNFIQNSEIFQKSSKTEWKKHKNLDKKLVHMLNNKVDYALKYDDLIEKSQIMTPQYIKEGLEWLIN